MTLLKDVLKAISNEIDKYQIKLKHLQELEVDQEGKNITIHRLYPRQSHVRGTLFGLNLLKNILIELTIETIETTISNTEK